MFFLETAGKTSQIVHMGLPVWEEHIWHCYHNKRNMLDNDTQMEKGFG